ncbi:MAG: hypothetical protein ABI451_04930 [Dokdonella sp.]
MAATNQWGFEKRNSKAYLPFEQMLQRAACDAAIALVGETDNGVGVALRQGESSGEGSFFSDEQLRGLLRLCHALCVGAVDLG